MLFSTGEPLNVAFRSAKVAGKRFVRGAQFDDARRRLRTLLVLTCGWAIATTGVASAAPFVPKRDAHCVAFSPDGKLAVIGYSGQSNEEFPPAPHPNPRKCGVVQWFDVASGRRLHRKETFGDITRVEFSSDGRFVAASRLYTSVDQIALHEVRVWLVATGDVEYVFDRCHAFTFSPSADEILVVSRRRCVAYQLAGGAKTDALDSLAGALAICCSPDGRQVAAVMANTNECFLRVSGRFANGPTIDSQQFTTPFYSVAFAPDGRQLASGHAGGNILLWNAATLAVEGRLQTGGSGLQQPFYSPDGQLVAAGDQQNSDVVFWDRVNGQEVRRYTFQQGALHSYHVRRGDAPLAPEKSPRRFAFAPDAQSFLAGPYGGIIRLVSTGQDVQRFGD